MSKLKRIKSAKTKNRFRHKVTQRQATSKNRGMNLSVGPGIAVHNGDFGSQIIMLKQLNTDQRQVVLAQIGRTQGNRHVQRLVETVRQGHQPSVSKVHLGIALPGVIQRTPEDIRANKAWLKEHIERFVTMIAKGELAPGRIVKVAQLAYDGFVDHINQNLGGFDKTAPEFQRGVKPLFPQIQDSLTHYVGIEKNRQRMVEGGVLRQEFDQLIWIKEQIEAGNLGHDYEHGLCFGISLNWISKVLKKPKLSAEDAIKETVGNLARIVDIHTASRSEVKITKGKPGLDVLGEKLFGSLHRSDVGQIERLIANKLPGEQQETLFDILYDVAPEDLARIFGGELEQSVERYTKEAMVGGARLELKKWLIAEASSMNRGGNLGTLIHISPTSQNGGKHTIGIQVRKKGKSKFQLNLFDANHGVFKWKDMEAGEAIENVNQFLVDFYPTVNFIQITRYTKT